MLALGFEANEDSTLTLHRCFSWLTVPRIPFQHPGVVAFVELVGGHGQVPIRLLIIDAAEEGNPATHAQIKIDFQDPTTVGIFPIVLRDVLFTRAGPHRLQLWAENDLLVNKRFDVTLVPEGASPGPASPR